MPEPDRQALASEKLFISGLFQGATAQRLIVSVYVPIRQDNKVTGLLILAQFPEHFARLLEEQGIPDGWTGAIVDDAGRIIARSREHDRFAGSMATPDLLENSAGQEGSWVGRTVEGTAVRAAYVRSSLSGWRTRCRCSGNYSRGAAAGISPLAVHHWGGSTPARPYARSADRPPAIARNVIAGSGRGRDRNDGGAPDA